MMDILPAYVSSPVTETGMCSSCATCAICAACLGDGPIPDFEGVALFGIQGLWGVVDDT